MMTVLYHLLFHPIAFIKFIFGKRQDLQNHIVLQAAQKLYGDSLDMDFWVQALREIDTKDYIVEDKWCAKSHPLGISPSTVLGKFIYAVVRAVKPGIVVETGVAHGLSSLLILNALHKNGGGILISVDLPNKDMVKGYNVGDVEMTGRIVPDVLKKQWQLYIGDAKDVLPEVMKDLDSLDVFFHDSEHTYKHMMFEFNTVYPKLRKGGLLISDDISKNNAFDTFAYQQKCDLIKFRKGGVIRKA